MYVCMYVCMCVCMYDARMYVCMFSTFPMSFVKQNFYLNNPRSVTLPTLILKHVSTVISLEQQHICP